MKQRLIHLYHILFTYQHPLSRILGIGVGILVVTYSVLLVQTINTVSERKELRTEIQEAQQRVSELETKYFELANTIDSNYVKQLGFVENADPVFAYTIPDHVTSSDSLAINIVSTKNTLLTH